MKKINLAFYSPTVLTLDGGLENFILKASSKLSKFCNVSLIAGKPLLKRRINLPKNIKILYFDYIKRSQMEKYQLEYAFPMECTSFFINSVDHLMHNKKYDIIHANRPTDIIIKPYIKTPLLIHFHDESLKKQAFLFEKFGADKYLACSKYIAQKNQKFVKKKIGVVYNGVDTDFFSPKYKKKKNEFLIFTIGRLTYYKGFDTLINAFKYVEKKNKNIKLHIGGKGPYEKELRNLVRKLKLKNVKFLGFVSQKELPKLYSNADIFINPRPKEPFGIVLLEAMACGTPVIAGKDGGPKEFVDKNVGFLADNTDPRDISKKILAAPDYDLVKMGENARKKVLKEFTWDVVARRLYNIYKKML